MGIVYQHIRAANEAAWPIQGMIKHFRPEMERRIAERAGGAGAMLEAAE
jgi:NADH-quinone oxidoreductase subunit F